MARVPLLAIVLLLTLPPAIAVDPSASASGPGVIDAPAPGGVLSRHDNVSVTYTWPMNTTGGKVNVTLLLAGAQVGNASRVQVPGTSSFTIPTHAPIGLTTGERTLAARFHYSNATMNTTSWHNVTVQYDQGPPSRQPILHDVSARYVVGSGFLVFVNASDPDAYDTLTVEIETDYDVTHHPLTSGGILQWALPDREGAHDVSVVVWDEHGIGTGKRLLVDVRATPVVVHDAEVEMFVGVHASVARIPVPDRLIDGMIEVTCAASCGAGALRVEFDHWKCTWVLPIHAGVSCPLDPRGGGSADLVWTQGAGSIRLRFLAKAL